MIYLMERGAPETASLLVLEVAQFPAKTDALLIALRIVKIFVIMDVLVREHLNPNHKEIVKRR